jgi:transcriptional regulator with XRE-family HTH domain
MNAPHLSENRLGAYLRDRRAKLDAAALGFPASRRRTPGLRREEVAQRAHISATWYTWLEQGRGGAPSADVLDRIARALMLTEVEREHLFLLGLGRPPEVRYREAEGVSPRLQRVLDALDPSPAMIKTLTWEVVAWNRAATVVLADYGDLPPEERNILRRIFCDPRSRAINEEWEHVARFVVAAFRADVARAGAGAEASVNALVEELSRRSPDFATMWAENDVRYYGDGIKTLRHPALGLVSFEYSAFAVDGRPDLGMIIYNPATTGDLERVRALVEAPTGHPLP